MKKKMTAVQFLIEELKLQELAEEHGLSMVREILKKAIEMEKKQMKHEKDN